MQSLIVQPNNRSTDHTKSRRTFPIKVSLKDEFMD